MHCGATQWFLHCNGLSGAMHCVHGLRLYVCYIVAGCSGMQAMYVYAYKMLYCLWDCCIARSALLFNH